MGECVKKTDIGHCEKISIMQTLQKITVSKKTIIFVTIQLKNVSKKTLFSVLRQPNDNKTISNFSLNLNTYDRQYER